MRPDTQPDSYRSRGKWLAGGYSYYEPTIGETVRAATHRTSLSWPRNAICHTLPCKSRIISLMNDLGR
eukprot:scaffold491905_cov28-Prasinocladus_malaysianus.AAC.1